LKTDSLFYRLFQTFPPLLFDLIGVTLSSADTYRFQSVEIKQTAFRLDGVFSPPEADIDSPLFFVEVQFQEDRQFYSRFFSELFLYLRQFDPANSWQAVVIYPSRTVDIGNTFHYDILLSSPKVTRLYLDELEESENASISFRLVKLITAPVSVAIASARDIIEQTYRETRERQQQLQLLDLLETIMVYKLPRLSREEIQQMMGLSDLDLKQTRFYQDVFAEGETEGRQEGRQEGRREEAAAIVLRQINRRFGSISSSLETQIRSQLSLDQIEILAEALFDFSELQELEAWLQNC
jgi:predicted transposase/invertase (TIGR01784 family)